MNLEEETRARLCNVAEDLCRVVAQKTEDPIEGVAAILSALHATIAYLREEGHDPLECLRAAEEFKGLSPELTPPPPPPPPSKIN